MTDRCSTLDGWRKHEAAMLKYSATWFDRYPLRAMRRRHDGRFQFGYDIAGYGTVVGHCVFHSHKTRAGAEECGRRFLAGQRPRRWRRR